MRRERTLLNLTIGFLCSILLHASFVVWGPFLALPASTPRAPRAVEVQLREWPVTPPSPQPLEQTAKIGEPPPPAPRTLPSPQPLTLPNTEALRQAVQEAITEARPEQAMVQLLQHPPLPKALESGADPLQIASSLMDALRFEPRFVDPGLDRHLPEPARLHAERQELAPLPAAERQPRREATPIRPAPIALPKSNPAAAIKGPAAERRVIFQPPLPHPIVESETEIELRFWILPNGTVGRVVPLKKANPRLEALAINYLRNWRFDPLPSDVPPVEQWGVIPFKFRIR